MSDRAGGEIEADLDMETPKPIRLESPFVFRDPGSPDVLQEIFAIKKPDQPTQGKVRIDEGFDPAQDARLAQEEAAQAYEAKGLDEAAHILRSNKVLSTQEAQQRAQQFSPEHPYGVPKVLQEALAGIHITPDKDLNMRSEIPPGMNTAAFEAWVDTVVKTAERGTDFYDPEYIKVFAQRISTYTPNGYDPAVSGPLEKFRADLENKIVCRGFLHLADTMLNNRRPKDYASQLTEFMYPGTLKTLWEEKLGTAENVIQGVADIMEQDQGLYWREEKVPDPAVPKGKGFIWAAGSKHAQVQAYLNHPGRFPDQDTKDLAQGLTEKLFKVTGMATHYAGPVDEYGELIDEKILDKIQAVINSGGESDPPDTTGSLEHKYVKNLNYWREWDIVRQKARAKGGLRLATDKPQAPGTERGPKDDAAHLARIFYLPEELARTDNTKAASLRYAMETYTRSFVHVNGLRTLKELMGVKASGFGVHVSRYASAVSGANEIYEEATSFLRQPIDQHANANSELEKDMGPMFEMRKKLGFLASGPTPQVFYYAEKQLAVATFGYANGKSPDRVREFPEMPRYGRDSMNRVMEALSADEYTKELGKRELGATDASVIIGHSADNVKESAFDFAKLLGEYFRSFLGK